MQKKHDHLVLTPEGNCAFGYYDLNSPRTSNYDQGQLPILILEIYFCINRTHSNSY